MALWRRVQPDIGAYLLMRTGSHQVADDIEQDTALTVWRLFHRYDDSRPFSAWVMGIAKNKLREHARRQPQRNRALLEEDAAVELPEDPPDRIADLQRCLQQLDPIQVDLLRRHYLDHAQPSALAEQEGCSANAMRVRLHRIRTVLRRCLGKKQEEGP